MLAAQVTQVSQCDVGSAGDASLAMPQVEPVPRQAGAGLQVGVARALNPEEPDQQPRSGGPHRRVLGAVGGWSVGESGVGGVH